MVDNRTGKRDFQSNSLLFFTISFIGWLFETLLCAIQSGRFCDRGFLTLPFCPIYGAPVCLLYLIFGRPTDGFFYRVASRKDREARGYVRVLRKIVAVLLYFSTAALLATAFELAVGLIAEDFGISLWSYGDARYCYKGLICLSVSLGWGILMTIFGQLIIPRLEKSLIALPAWLKRGLTAVLWTAMLADFFYNSVYLLRNGKQFDYRKYFER